MRRPTDEQVQRLKEELNRRFSFLLSCGCPSQIVADEGHQEGCEER